jgi:2-keto-4-pentenoate hydratase/2-oxohepta-3-ene-1,7-dioic acid hydratase in catechol pathway
MRYIAYREDQGVTLMGVVVDGAVAPLCGIEEFYSDAARYRAEAARATAGGFPVESARPAVPAPASTRVICAGLNYRAHAEEAHGQPPKYPDVFGRWASTLTVSGTDVPLPPREERFDWEGELCAVIGAHLTDVTIDEAAAGILGYACFNDLSARDFQFAAGQYALGKNADRSGPIGSQIVEPGDLDDARDLEITTHVNGELKQKATTAQLIFTAAEIASYVSGCMSLRPGDVISTGTPAGVGFARTPPERLAPGDTVTVTIAGIGSIENRIVARAAYREKHDE